METGEALRVFDEKRGETQGRVVFDGVRSPRVVKPTRAEMDEHARKRSDKGKHIRDHSRDVLNLAIPETRVPAHDRRPLTCASHGACARQHADAWSPSPPWGGRRARN